MMAHASRQIGTASSTGVFALFAVMSFACVGPALTPTDPEQLPEDRITGAQLLQSFTHEGEQLVSPRLEAPALATRVAVFLVATADWQGRSLSIEARGIDLGGAVGPWQPIGFTFIEPPFHVGHVELDAVAEAVQLRVAQAQVEGIAELTWSALVPPQQGEAGELALGAAGAGTQQRQALDSYLVGLGVVSREAWGARGHSCSSWEADKWRMTIHHSAGSAYSSDYAAGMRAMQAYAQDSLGYCDMHYHLVISADGRLWEGRPLAIRGSHILNLNTGNIGISFLGCYQPGGCVYPSSTIPETPLSAAMLENTGRLVGALGAHYGIAIDPTLVMGHRDYPGTSTGCPGDTLHARVPEILSMAQGGTSVPSCVTDPNYGRCDGSVITHCVDGQLSSGDCAVYGCTCHDDALGARCVFFACPPTGVVDICFLDTNRGRCEQGALVEQHDCAEQGLTCALESGDSRCVTPGVDAGLPDAAEPDAAEPDAAEPDAGEPNIVEPDAGEPDNAVPDAGASVSLDSSSSDDSGAQAAVSQDSALGGAGAGPTSSSQDVDVSSERQGFACAQRRGAVPTLPAWLLLAWWSMRLVRRR